MAPRDRSCTRRDRSGGGAIALTRWGKCCYDPMLVSALSRCCLGVGMWVGREAKGWFGDRLVESGILVVRLGVAPRDRSCTRRDRSGGGAIALMRLGGSVATIQCSFRPCPAAAAFYGVVGKELLQNGLWVVYEATQTTLPP